MVSFNLVNFYNLLISLSSGLCVVRDVASDCGCPYCDLLNSSIESLSQFISHSFSSFKTDVSLVDVYKSDSN